MKANKKAIFGMLVAMVMSMGIMQGINVKNQTNHDTNLQQCWGLLCACNTEPTTTGQNVALLCVGTVMSTIVGCGCPPLGIAMGF